MGNDYIVLLGPEGDRLDAFAALHGIVASLALALARRGALGTVNRRVARQARRLNALATALARAFRQGDTADIDALAATMVRAAACERYGVPHARLIAMPIGCPLRGLPISPPALALVAVMRLRQGLQDSLILAANPRCATQLRMIRDLEANVLSMVRDVEQNAISSAEALRRLRARFAAAEPMIGADLPELLGGAEAIAQAIIAAIGTNFHPAT